MEVLTRRRGSRGPPFRSLKSLTSLGFRWEVMLAYKHILNINNTAALIWTTNPRSPVHNIPKYICRKIKLEPHEHVFHTVKLPYPPLTATSKLIGRPFLYLSDLLIVLWPPGLIQSRSCATHTNPRIAAAWDAYSKASLRFNTSINGQPYRLPIND